ncbi:MAG TPA: NAD-dependent epimerase/dehydratase family protein [Longimicrobium sp.]|nr:NAD-dependent epimerase/dehydratase family protein [Longimicrobium sp.]
MSGGAERMRVALTGATGTIGSRLLDALRAAGHDAVALARPGAGMDALRAKGVKVAGWDLDRPEVDPEVLRGVDAVLHLAAYIPPRMDDPAEAEPCLRRNALGTLGLLRAAREAKVRRFVYFSSGQVYQRQDRPVREDDPVYPAARAPYYLTSKLAGEVYASHLGSTGSMDVAILRVASVYGPGCHGLVTRFLARAAAGEPIVVVNDGRYRVDLVFVDDVVDAAAKVLERRATGIFNVGSGRGAAIRDVAEIALRLSGAHPSLVHSRPGPDDPGFSALDVGRAARELGYAPLSLEEGMARCAAVPV